ncbi:MAG TPA: hypothetical protein VF222_12435 [Nitrososphaeraceae archaeon]
MKLQLLSKICYLLVIGIFSASQNCVYGQEYTTAGVEDKTVELLSPKVKSGEYSDKLIEQVHNNIDKNVEYVQIIATFYDQNEGMFGSKSTYAQPSDLKQNMKAPLEMFLDDDVANELSAYDVTLTWRHPRETEEYSNIYELSQQ